MIDPSVFSTLKIGMLVTVSFSFNGKDDLESWFGDSLRKVQGVLVRKTREWRQLKQREALKLNIARLRENVIVLCEMDDLISWTIPFFKIHSLEIVPITRAELLTCNNEELREFASMLRDF